MVVPYIQPQYRAALFYAVQLEAEQFSRLAFFQPRPEQVFEALGGTSRLRFRCRRQLLSIRGKPAIQGNRGTSDPRGFLGS